MAEQVTVFGSPNCEWSSRLTEDASWKDAGYAPSFGAHPRLVNCDEETERCTVMNVEYYPTICNRTMCLPGYATIPSRYQTSSRGDWDVATFVRDECLHNPECYSNPTASTSEATPTPPFEPE